PRAGRRSPSGGPTRRRRRCPAAGTTPASRGASTWRTSPRPAPSSRSMASWCSGTCSTGRSARRRPRRSGIFWRSCTLGSGATTRTPGRSSPPSAT
ncbi:unnamed protein product, partial [Prorocentrum cordatum]